MLASEALLVLDGVNEFVKRSFEKGMVRAARWKTYELTAAVPVTLPVIGWRHCKKCLLIDVSHVHTVSFSPDDLTECLEVKLPSDHESPSSYHQRRETANNQTKADAKGEHSNSEAATEVKPGALELEDDEDGEEKAAEDGPHNLLERCSAAVLQKANRLAALVVQQAPTLWRLPASLRSLLDSLVSYLPVTRLSPSHNVVSFIAHQHQLATSSCFC
ncbi:hypothetical protein CSKR_102126 [Clonorchis sinensis]|uniref:Uncharacterized protein n=1 Tax=Clonorchis sinensis TaxID=79923 RepID=A0A419QA04_CLOSI|nr:hypothetical protein CSKR_102126 [Clonorchis sinensis]